MKMSVLTFLYADRFFVFQILEHFISAINKSRLLRTRRQQHPEIHEPVVQ